MLTLPRRSTALRAGLVVTALVAAGLVAASGQAQAFGGAFWPTQSKGNKGSDVVALQYLLQQSGRDVAADGDFGGGTDAAVKSYQKSKSLDDDGIVGPGTWGSITVTVKEGSKGPAVKAVQSLLNAKHGAKLAVDGDFGAGTKNAVVSFQHHAGIDADGIVGDTTWKNLLWHYQYLDMSAGFCDKNPDGNASANWGTGAAIGQLEAGVRAFGTGNGKVPVGDIAFEHGGNIDPHASHEVGLDADIWPIRNDSAQCSADRITWQSPSYDRAATRQLVKALRAAAPGHVKLVFFNDPQLISEGLTSRYDEHDNHLHIRYCERVHPNDLYRC